MLQQRKLVHCGIQEKEVSGDSWVKGSDSDWSQRMGTLAGMEPGKTQKGTDRILRHRTVCGGIVTVLAVSLCVNQC